MGLLFLVFGIFSISLIEIGGVPQPAIQESNPDLDNFRDLSFVIEAGLKEFGAKISDPIILKKFEYEQVTGPVNIYIGAEDTKFTGYSRYKALHVGLDRKENLIRFEFQVPYLKLETEYKLSGNAFFFPIHGAGPAKFEIMDHKMIGHAKYKIIDKLDGTNDEKVLQLVEPVISTIEIGDLRSKIRGLYEGNPLFSALTKYFETRYWREIFELAKPEVSKYAGELMINEILNPVLKQIPFVTNYLELE